VSDSIAEIDVSKESLDANCARGQRKQSTFKNSPDGWKLMLAWFTALGSKKAHVCMEATGRHSLGVALALHAAGHIVQLIARRGARPLVCVSDNGTELTSTAIPTWSQKSQVGWHYNARGNRRRTRSPRASSAGCAPNA
jgi:transposase